MSNPKKAGEFAELEITTEPLCLQSLTGLFSMIFKNPFKNICILLASTASCSKFFSVVLRK